MMANTVGRVNDGDPTQPRAAGRRWVALALDPTYALVAGLFVALALAAPASGVMAQGAPNTAVNCRGKIEPILAQQREIQPIYLKAELAGKKPDACRLATAYVRTLDQLKAALNALPPGCTPSNAGLQQQYVSRERIAWLGKAQRNCGLDAGPVRQQHKIIKVE